MKEIKTQEAAQPLGHYAQAIAHGGLVYVSMQLGINPQDPKAAPASADVQTRNCLNNIAAILKAADTSCFHILKVIIYLSDIKLWDEVNAVYTDFMGVHRPARGVVPIGKLHHGFDVAFDVIAVLPCDQDI